MAIVSIVLSYLLGSVSFSYLLGRLLKGIDIRKHGSGNAGATNTLRILGTGPGIAVLLLDMAKGMGAVWLPALLGQDQPWLQGICGIAVIAGHNWPVYFGFKGGKGIASTVGVMASLAFWPALFAGLITIAAIALTRYVSLGSLLFVAFVPIFILALNRPMTVFWISLLIAIFAFLRHRTNITRLVKGQENKLGKRRKVS